MNENQYRCDNCGGVFDKGWSDEEAAAERDAAGFVDVDCAVVCDDCYVAIMRANGHEITGSSGETK
jgi:rubredoxin